MKALCICTALCFVVSGTAFGVPQSDGSIFLETFTNYPEHPLSAAINVGAVVADGAVRLTTTTETEGVFRASPLPLTSGQEYVVEFDWTLHEPSGDNFYMFYSQGPESPYFSGIALRTIPMGDDWIFQVDYGVDQWEWSELLIYDQLYHVTIHVKPGASLVDLYVDGLLIGEYESRNPSITTDLVQWGDGSGGAGYGDATVDNISIGLLATAVDADFNNDGFIDAADYVAWRKSLISGNSGYQAWRMDYGTTSPGSGSTNAVPEPASTLLILIGTACLPWSTWRSPRADLSKS